MRTRRAASPGCTWRWSVRWSLVGLLGAGWALLRARPVAVASPGAPVSVSTPVPEVGSATPERTSTPAPTIVVHVLGAVRDPAWSGCPSAPGCRTPSTQPAG